MVKLLNNKKDNNTIVFLNYQENKYIRVAITEQRLEELADQKIHQRESKLILTF